MSTIVLRSVKGSPLTNTEVDANFNNLNTDKIETLASADGSIVITGTGASRDLSVSQTSPASVLLEQVRNATGATLTKGTAVYISGATGQIPTVSKALATGDATSAQTLGLITSDLANNANGYVTIIGLVTNLNTSAYTDGAQLYLSPTTAGTLTATKPYAPMISILTSPVILTSSFTIKYSYLKSSGFPDIIFGKIGQITISLGDNCTTVRRRKRV